MLNTLFQAVGAALDGLEVAFCAFDSQDRTLAWNETFLRFFPEHRGRVHAGEHYSENLRRFYRDRLGPEEKPLLERYVAEGVERHRHQRRPYEFEHLERRLRVSCVEMGKLGRVRVWKSVRAAGEAPQAAIRPAAVARLGSGLALLERLPDGVSVVDVGDRTLWGNAAFLQLYGISCADNAQGRSLEEIFRAAWHEAGGEAPQASLEALQEYRRFSGAPFELPLPGDRWARVTEQPADETDGRAFLVHVDITALKRQQRALQEAEARYHLLAEYSSDITMAVEDGRIAYVSPSVTKMLGWAPGQLEGRPMAEFCHPEDLPAVMQALETISGGLESDYRARARSADGGFHWVEARARRLPDTSSQAVVLNVRSIVSRKAIEDELAAAHRRLEQLASTDSLTGLWNRRVFDQALDSEWRRCQREGWPLSLLAMDLDNFKALNDRHGHPAGDEVLRRVSRVIGSFARRAGDIAARTGGEEFSLLLPNTSLSDAATVAEQVRAAIAGCEMPPGLPRVTVSVGVCCLDEKAAHCVPEELVHASDEALYAAKRSGKNRVAITRCTCDGHHAAISESGGV